MTGRIIAVPRRGIPYVDCLYNAVTDSTVEMTDGESEWSGLWPFRKVFRGDLVHVHWPSFCYDSPGSAVRTWRGLISFIGRVMLARMLGARFVWTAHNLYPHDGGRDKLVHRIARLFFTRIVQTIFVHGPTAADAVAREWNVPRRTIVQIPHGNWIDYYPHDIPREEARRRLNLSPTTFVYGFVGLCKPYKGLEKLIESFSRSEGDCALMIAGAFQSDEYLATISKLLADLPPERVRFEPRFLKADEVQYYLTACDAFVTPYRQILTSGSAILALSFGRPVVAPNLGNLRDIIHARNGVLYDPGSPVGLLDAMRAVRSATFSEDEILAGARSMRWSEAADALIHVLRA